MTPVAGAGPDVDELGREVVAVDVPAELWAPALLGLWRAKGARGEWRALSLVRSRAGRGVRWLWALVLAFRVLGAGARPVARIRVAPLDVTRGLGLRDAAPARMTVGPPALLALDAPM